MQKVEEITCNGVPLVKLAEEEYVYDVYTMQSDAFSSTDSENSFKADDFDVTNIVDISFLDCRDLNEDEEFYRNPCEDSDSNDEDNWRNDYPDEDDFSDFEDDYNEGNNEVDLDFEKFHLRWHS